MKFLDQAKIYVKGGSGGSGSSSFRREKFIEFGGPDGGNGGKGGDVFIKGTKSLNTLVDYRFQKHFKAKKGRHGSGRNRTGAAGQDVMLKLPLGTEIFIEDELLADVISTDKFLLFPGGKGGLGNINFKSSTNRAPRKTTPGGKGQEAEVFFKLKLLADIGLVGLPNAGKSSLLAAVTSATPKIANYKFTTLNPNLGVAIYDDKEITLADIPGLIEGAHKGVGLGIKFLKHIERCKTLLHLIDINDDDLITSYKQVRGELKKYSKDLVKKDELIVLNKIDLVDKKELKEKINILTKKIKKNVLTMTILDKKSVSEIKSKLIKYAS